MEKLLKSITIFLGMFFVSATLLILVFAWQKVFPSQPINDRTLPITSEGRVSVRPDLGQVTLSLTSEGKDPKSIEGKNAEKVNSIIAFLKNEGVKSEDIKTSEFSLQPKYYSPWDYPRIPCPVFDAEGNKIFPCPPINQIVVGYTITQSLAIKLRTFEKVGTLLSGAIERGATQVNSLVFSVDDPDQYKKEARAIAIRKAKDQAKELADAGGFKVGKVLSIQEGYSYFPQPYRLTESTGAPSPEKATPQIEPGSQDVFVTLTVLFQIK